MPASTSSSPGCWFAAAACCAALAPCGALARSAAAPPGSTVASARGGATGDRSRGGRADGGGLPLPRPLSLSLNPKTNSNPNPNPNRNPNPTPTPTPNQVEALNAALLGARYDVRGLTAAELLRLDYKVRATHTYPTPRLPVSTTRLELPDP